MNAITTTTTPASAPDAPIVQRIADVQGDAHLIELWLQNKRSEHTRKQYERAITLFLAFTGPKPLKAITLNDVQGFAEYLESGTCSTVTIDTLKRERVHVIESTGTVKTYLSAVKSLLSWGHKLGYLDFNVGAPMETPKPKNTLAERILTEEQVLTIIHSETNTRNRVLLRLLYASAGRVSEICHLTWKDVQPNKDGGQVTLFGKGEKTRVVVIGKSTWDALQGIRGDAPSTAPVFQSRKSRNGGHLSRVQVLRIVKDAAHRAGITEDVTPHWFRHAHASHAIDRGAPLPLVRDTLGHASLAVTSMYTHAKPGESSSKYLPV